MSMREEASARRRRVGGEEDPPSRNYLVYLSNTILSSLSWPLSSLPGIEMRPNCGPGGDRSFRLRVGPRRRKHSSSRRKWPHWIQRLINFHPSTCPPQCNSSIRNKWAFQIDPNSHWGSETFWFRSWRRRNNHKPCNYPCRRPQRMALRRQRGFNQWNQIPNKSRQNISHIFLQGTYSAMHQRSGRNISCVRQQFSNQSTYQCYFRSECGSNRIKQAPPPRDWEDYQQRRNQEG